MNRRNPFVVDTLQPERIGGPTGGGIYQLTESSVSPEVITGYDDAGMPIVETVPAAYSRKFVMPDGGINTVPLRTAAVFSMEPEHERYEHVVMRDIIQRGALPLTACPYSNEYKHIKGGPLVTVPPGEQDCGGAPNAHNFATACPHMQAVITERKARAYARWENNENQGKQLTKAGAQALVRQYSEAFGMVAAAAQDDEVNAPTPPNTSRAKQRLRDDKSE